LAGPALGFPLNHYFDMTVFTILAASNPISDIAQQFGVDWWKFLSSVISFSIVAFILYKYSYNPILQVLEQRRHKIEDGLRSAEEMKKQLATAQQQATELLAKAGTDAQKVIDDAKASAKAIIDRESARATAEAEQIIAKAHEATVREHAKMLSDLKREVARLVINTTTKVTGKLLTDDDQKRLSEEATKELAA
jgi:F-type H+-transporting ATPase subunit b